MQHGFLLIRNLIKQNHQLFHKYHILTSKRNASSKTLHNLLHEQPICAKLWSILIFVCVLLNNILKIWFSLQKFSKRGWAHHFKGCTVRNEISQKRLKVVLQTSLHKISNRNKNGKHHEEIMKIMQGLFAC